MLRNGLVMMKKPSMRSLIVMLGAIAASPAQAQSSAAVPEPNNLVLLGLGVVGLLVGRHVARRKKD